MRLTATADEVRALVGLAELDAEGRPEPEDPAVRQRRTAFEKRVRPDLLERYEALFGRGRRPAAAALTHGRCSGCHVRLPAALEYEARQGLGLFTCPHCRRMLYAPGQLEEKPVDRVPPPPAVQKR